MGWGSQVGCRVERNALNDVFKRLSGLLLVWQRSKRDVIICLEMALPLNPRLTSNFTNKRQSNS